MKNVRDFALSLFLSHCLRSNSEMRIFKKREYYIILLLLTCALKSLHHKRSKCRHLQLHKDLIHLRKTEFIEFEVRYFYSPNFIGKLLQILPKFAVFNIQKCEIIFVFADRNFFKYAQNYTEKKKKRFYGIILADVVLV